MAVVRYVSWYPGAPVGRMTRRYAAVGTPQVIADEVEVELYAAVVVTVDTTVVVTAGWVAVTAFWSVQSRL